MGASWISRKGGILEKGGGGGADLEEEGGYDPISNYAFFKFSS